jgi:hypothetical protein
MTATREMLDAAPVRSEFDAGALAAAIDACMVCAQACTSCANSCLAEDDVAPMARCIALCDVCADLCTATLRVLSRPFGADHVGTERLLNACVRACENSAEECHRHAPHHRHCAICERVCRVCLDACVVLLESNAA